MGQYVIPLSSLSMRDVAKVGGKNASLGELLGNLQGLGVNVPGGFATTADAFREFLEHNDLVNRIDTALSELDTDDVEQLAKTGAEVRSWVRAAELPQPLKAAIAEHYAALEASLERDFSVAVRSSATAEDLPEASFAGQQETFLNIHGLDSVLGAVREVFASLYNDRAIAYRVHHDFEHAGVALSAGIQQMVRSDRGTSGVMFTLDTETGFRDVVFITASYGLGETVVQGAVNPDEFYVHKPTLAAGRPAVLRRTLGSKAVQMIYADSREPGRSVQTIEVAESQRQQFCLSDAEVEALARQAVAIEAHYGRPMDIEWGQDGEDGELYILQARPETVRSRGGQFLERFHLQREGGEVIVTGRSIGHRIGSGVARVIASATDMHRVKEGEVLVTDMTDPDWEPIMKRAAAIVTNRGGRTCHAAIIARELGIPAVVGCNDATELISEGEPVTVSCAEGDEGRVYKGMLEYECEQLELGKMPELPVNIMMNVGNPDRAFDFAGLPHRGVGLARLEFIINRMIGVHPKALLDFDQLDARLQARVARQMSGYKDPVTFFVQRLAEGIATIAAAFHPQPVIVRLSDFKSNEYANLIGGKHYEPHEENPMLGFRGASRYLAESFRSCFELECRALRYVREEMGLGNVELMVPFVRTPAEAKAVVELLAANGLRRGDHGLRLIMMCELPSNALLAEQFLEHFDGFSIGSNDLTQLTLGLDRDSGLVAELFDERNEAVKMLLQKAISACRAADKYIGICGQGPSDHPDLAHWLLEQGISSISLNPDTVVETWNFLGKYDETGDRA